MADIYLNISSLENRALEEIKNAKTLQDIDSVRVRYLGKKGEVTALLKGIGQAPPEERPKIGAKVNALREKIEELVSQRLEELRREETNRRLLSEKVDVTLPGAAVSPGALHPLTRTLREVERVFYGMGFTVFESREVETDEMNFVNLNIAPGHPARDMQETFYITPDMLLRTHTSPGQIRGMRALGGKLPVRFIVPGRVYRRDPTDASHHPVFHQVEGLAVDVGITFRDLKGVLLGFAEGIFGKGTKVRLRPSYFPFTEPSAEVDVSCVFCQGKGCSVCGYTGWLEVAGAGMVHPNVLRNGGYDPDVVTGFAFGFGLDRITMLKYGIDDIRVLFSNDKRFLQGLSGI